MVKHHPADVALRFIAIYSEVQETCERAVSRHVLEKMPHLGKSILRGADRWTDKERITAVRALAEDVGAADQFVNVPGVFLELKVLRDTIGHATLLGSLVDEQGGGVSAIKGGTSLTLSLDELVAQYWRAFWVFEQCAYVNAVAGGRTIHGTVMTRRSGVSLLESPPPVKPPRGPNDDPVQLWEIVEEG